MNTEALLKLLIGVASGAASVLLALMVFVWRASRDWTHAGGRVDALVSQVKQLVDRIDLMAGQLDSIRIWRAAHQATSDAQEDRLGQLERATR